MKTYTYQGYTIKNDGSRFELVGVQWGNGIGETHRFKTLTAAKRFIDTVMVPGNHIKVAVNVNAGR